MVDKSTVQPDYAEALAAIECLGQLTELYRARREQLAATVDLTEHQWAVLEKTTTDHFMPSMFARSRQSSAAAVSKTLRQLIDKGLVRAAIDLNDGRQRRYELTNKGRRTMDQLQRSRETAIHDVWMTFEARRLRAFTQFGSELADKLERYARRASQDPAAKTRTSKTIRRSRANETSDK